MASRRAKVTSLLQLFGMTGPDLVLLRELGSDIGCACGQTKTTLICFHCETLYNGDASNLTRMGFVDNGRITESGYQLLDSLSLTPMEELLGD